MNREPNIYKKDSRSIATGQSLLSQGEPMVWLTGGMFAIACTMIATLLGFILVQGLATHWQRPFVIYELNDGQQIAGELQYSQPYEIQSQSLQDLDAVSLAQAKKVLAGREQATSSQLYLRTGNYDVTNRHFAFVPEIKLKSNKAEVPRDVWLVERREWGVLYGFPVQLKGHFSVEQDESLRKLSILVDQLGPLLPKEDSDLQALQEWMRAELDKAAETRKKEWEAKQLSTQDPDRIASSVTKAIQQISDAVARMESAKHALGASDRELSNSRLLIRKAELASKLDLQSIAEQTLELAAAEGNLHAQSDELKQSIDLWQANWKSDASRSASLSKLQGFATKAQQEMLDPIVEGKKELFESFKQFSSNVERALQQAYERTEKATRTQYETSQRVAVLEEQRKTYSVEFKLPATEPDVLKEVQVSDIVRFVMPNQLGFFGRLGLYAIRWWEFLFGQPREAGTEGGFFPAIWGTIVMTLIMSIAVMPFGVIAALYMREYAKPGIVLSLIRICINNLAGVPSIVYGVFGLAFFCYTIGGYVDGGPARAGFEPWPSAIWFSALAATAIIGTVAFFLAFLGSGSPAHMSKWRKRISGFSGLFWFASLLLLIALFAKSPFFSGFYQASLPNPTFGKGCLLWASCTLALLTLPVVIVATEEALSAVPNSLREGSYACGAGKWQTLQRIVLPYARPGIITGFILAMARGAGEVAPMMLVGAIPLATELPLDLEFPFLHGSRSFMHLGFQIYSLGFQSQNSEAAKPMVFTATLLLLTIVTLLNLTAIWLRARLRKRFQGSQF